MNLAGVIGADLADLEDRLGVPDAQREVDDDLWLVYRRGNATLRVRCVAGGPGAPDGDATRADASRRREAEEGVSRPSRGEKGPAASGTNRPRAASWTLTWEEPRATLRRALEPLGLWPAGSPDVRAEDVETQGGRMVRRALPDPSGPGAHSLTAGVAAGGFDRVAAFDEAPEWT